MSFAFPEDLQHQIDIRITSGRYASPEEVLRDAFRALAEEDEDITAVREAVDDWRRGDDGLPLREAIDAVRNRQPAE